MRGGPLRPSSRQAGLAKQLEDHLGRLVRDRQRLDAELLLHLQRLQSRRYEVQIRIYEPANTVVDRGLQACNEGLLELDAGLARAKGRRRRGHIRNCRIDLLLEGIQLCHVRR